MPIQLEPASPCLASRNPLLHVATKEDRLAAVSAAMSHVGFRELHNGAYFSRNILIDRRNLAPHLTGVKYVC